jgi:hypothetical protein
VRLEKGRQQRQTTTTEPTTRHYDKEDGGSTEEQTRAKKGKQQTIPCSLDGGGKATTACVCSRESEGLARLARLARLAIQVTPGACRRLDDRLNDSAIPWAWGHGAWTWMGYGRMIGPCPVGTQHPRTSSHLQERERHMQFIHARRIIHEGRLASNHS